ncbi:MAG TPA: hypothetical protein VHY18_11240 [Solirubrobacteraceae bacterium]|jgi:DNA-binding transcriptional ArsR family regulator|nr:hypothetical protein [Solirubrobacteraceae bacterium]
MHVQLESQELDRRQQASQPRDLLSLMSAPVSELLEELAAAADGAHDEPGVPARALQLADMLMAEVVRLIRLGTRAQLSRAAEDLAQAIVDPGAEQLEQSAPEAHELLMSSASALAAAVAPSSSGGEIAVLRSWRGKAREALALIARAPEQGLARADLQAALGDMEGSHLSHVLADLDSAGLIERIKAGREVIIHLGPTAYTEHVKQIIDQSGESPTKRTIRQVLEAAIADGEWEAGLVGPEAALQLMELHERVEHFRGEAASADVSIKEIIGGEPMTIVVVRVTGRLLDGNAALEVVDDELLWSVRLESGRIVDITPWVHARRWLGRPPVRAQPRSQPAWLLSRTDKVGPTIDATGEHPPTERALAWLPGGSRQIAEPTAVGAGVTNTEKPPARGSSPESTAFLTFLTELDLEVAVDDHQSLR